MRTTTSDKGSVVFSFLHLYSDTTKISKMNDEELRHYIKMRLNFSYKVSYEQYESLIKEADNLIIGTDNIEKILSEIFPGKKFTKENLQKITEVAFTGKILNIEKYLKEILPLKRKITFKEIIKVRTYGTYALFSKHPKTICKLSYLNSAIGMTDPISVVGESKLFMTKTKKDNFSKSEGRRIALEKAIKLLRLEFTKYANSSKLDADYKRYFHTTVIPEIEDYYYKSINKSKTIKIKNKNLFFSEENGQLKLSITEPETTDSQQNPEKLELSMPLKKGVLGL